MSCCRKWQVLSLTVIISTLAVVADGLDPDIQDALKHAPPPGDFSSVLLMPELSPFAAKLQDEDDSEKTERFQLQSKLLHIRIPSISFKDTPTRVAFQWIAEQSVALDPTHKGVTFIFEVDDKVLDQKISVSHQDVPLDEAIRYLTTLLDLRFDVERGSVILRHRK